jgi:hypothetical protein
MFIGATVWILISEKKELMNSRRQSWQEKLADKEGLPKTLTLEKNFPCYNAAPEIGAEVGEKIVLVNSSEVVGEMKEVQAGTH